MYPQRNVSAEEFRDGFSIVDDPNSSVGITESSPSQLLGANLERGGMLNPGPGHEAHHIIPAAHNNVYAQGAREIIEHAGLDINGSNNGIWLRRGADVPLDATMTRHEWIHTNKYFRALYTELSEAGGDPERVQETLRNIRQRIADDDFPY